MSGAPWISFAVLACLTQTLAVAADEVLVEQLRQDVRELTRTVHEQARQIERLERELARIKAAAAHGRPRAPRGAVTEGELAWLSSKPWKELRSGMSEPDVVALLGPPTAVRGEPPAPKTLLYALELEGTGFLSGSVVLENGRVSAINEPRLR